MRENEVDEGRRSGLGTVTIAPGVLVTIVQKTANSIPGVACLCESVPGVKRLLHSVGNGVEVSVVHGQVIADLYLVAKRDVDLLQLGRQLQREITRAIEDIVGMGVREVNIHIEDIRTELPLEGEGKGSSRSQ